MDGTEFDWDSYYSQGNNREEAVDSVAYGTSQSNSAPNNEMQVAPAMSMALAIRLATENINEQADCIGQLNDNVEYLDISECQEAIRGLRNLGDCVLSSPVYPVQTKDGVGVFIAGLTVVAGRQGSSKSTIIRKIIADISSPSGAGTFVAEEGNSAKAIVVNKEDDENSIYSPEVVANGGNPRNVHYLTERHWGPDWLAEIENHLVQNRDCKILLVDTIEAFAAKLGFSKITSKVVHQILDPLSELGRRYRVAIVATCHLTKRQANHVLDRIAGSVELTGSARLVYSVAPHALDSSLRVMESAKSNQRGHLERLVYQAEIIPLEEGIRMARNLGIRVDNDLAPDTFVRVNIVEDNLGEESTSSIEIPFPVTYEKRESQGISCAKWIQAVLVEQGGEIASNELIKLAVENGFTSSTVANARAILRKQNLIQSYKKGPRSWLALQSPEIDEGRSATLPAPSTTRQEEAGPIPDSD